MYDGVSYFYRTIFLGKPSSNTDCTDLLVKYSVWKDELLDINIPKQTIQKNKRKSSILTCEHTPLKLSALSARSKS